MFTKEELEYLLLLVMAEISRDEATLEARHRSGERERLGELTAAGLRVSIARLREMERKLREELEQ